MKTLWIALLVWFVAAAPCLGQRPTVRVEFCLKVDQWVEESANQRGDRDQIIDKIVRGTSALHGLAKRLTMFDFLQADGEEPADFLLHVVLKKSGEIDAESSIPLTDFELTLIPATDANRWWVPGTGTTPKDILEGDSTCRASKLLAPDSPLEGLRTTLGFKLKPNVQFGSFYKSPEQFSEDIRAGFLTAAKDGRDSKLVPILLGPLTWGSEAFALIEGEDALLVMPFSWDEIGAYGQSPEGQPSLLEVVVKKGLRPTQVQIAQVPPEIMTWKDVEELVSIDFLTAYESPQSSGAKILAEETEAQKKEAGPEKRLKTLLGEGYKLVKLKGIFINRHFPALGASEPWSPE